MFFKRRRSGASGLPRLLPGAWKSAPAGAWLALALMCAALPLLALSAATLALLELALLRRRRAASA